MDRLSDGTYIKKGPWTAEEDEELMNYVKTYGPRDWSSIRSMGLLPRTGKSCRLRWVNKLRPNLKTGCKFSAEEERLVIELQAQFGNKWAKIATYLPGRTDNDVKNFWSTRRKRLERMLKTPLQKPQKNKGKNPVSHELPIAEEVPHCSPITSTQAASSYLDQSHPPSSSGNTEEFKMVPLQDLVKPDLLNLETELPLHEVTPIHMMPSFESVYHYPFTQFPQYQLGLPFWPEYQELSSEPIDSMLLDITDLQDASKTESDPKFLTGLPPLGLESKTNISKNGETENPATVDSLFDEFPTDMFD